MFITVFKYSKENGIAYYKFREMVEKEKDMVPTKLGNVNVYKVEDLDRLLKRSTI